MQKYSPQNETQLGYVKLNGLMTTYKIILKNGMCLQKYSYLSSNSPKKTKLGIKLILSHRFFSGLSLCKLSHLSIHEYL